VIEIRNRGRGLRKQDRAMTEDEIWGFLREARIARVATTGPDGWPYVVPFHYAVRGTSVVIHCASDGHFLRNVQSNPKVCFEVDEALGLIKADRPCDWSEEYRSVVAFGEARILRDQGERQEALSLLVARYGGEPVSLELSGVEVVEIELKVVTGKKNSRLSR